MKPLRHAPSFIHVFRHIEHQSERTVNHASPVLYDQVRPGASGGVRKKRPQSQSGATVNQAEFPSCGDWGVYRGAKSFENHFAISLNLFLQPCSLFNICQSILRKCLPRNWMRWLPFLFVKLKMEMSYGLGWVCCALAIIMLS